MPNKTTIEAAREIGVSKSTLLSYLRTEKIKEPKIVTVGATKVRVWTEADIARAKAFKEEHYRKRS